MRNNKKYNRQKSKVESFHQLVTLFFSSYFENNYHLIEFCCGNGNGGKIFSLDDKVERVTYVDVKSVRGLERNLMNFNANVSLEGIDAYSIPNYRNVAVIAIHACGNLTDKIIEKVVDARVPLAVMPCCYNNEFKNYCLINPPNPRILTYDRKEDYYDTFRLRFLQENNYKVKLEKIDPRITKMNNVIIGLPESFRVNCQ